MIDPDALLSALEENTYGLGNIGFCTSCGAEADGCEPDARQYACDSCGKNTVFGAEELLMMGYGS